MYHRVTVSHNKREKNKPDIFLKQQGKYYISFLKIKMKLIGFVRVDDEEET